jgi:large subunit ribosomal protein L14
MIFTGTKLQVLDNAGGLTAKCIRVLKRPIAYAGDLIIITIKSHNPYKPKIRTHQVHRAIVIQSRYFQDRKISQYVKFPLNGVVLLKRNEDLPFGKRVGAAVCFELRKKGFFRILLMGLFVI